MSRERQLRLCAPEIGDTPFSYPSIWDWPPPPALHVIIPTVLECCMVLRRCESELGLGPPVCAVYSLAEDRPDDLVALCSFAEGFLPCIVLTPRKVNT